MASLDSKPDDELMKKMQVVLADAYLTKSSGVMMVLFKEASQMTSLRSDIQREVRWMRKMGLSEKTHLHPLLADRVAKVIAMRAP